jgi:hypothetical protein
VGELRFLSLNPERSKLCRAWPRRLLMSCVRRAEIHPLVQAHMFQRPFRLPEYDAPVEEYPGHIDVKVARKDLPDFTRALPIRSD